MNYKKSYLVYRVNIFDGISLVAEADTLELCESYLKSDKFRVVECYKRIEE